LETLSVSSGVNKHTLKKYLEYLEAAFLIKQIHRIDESGKHFKRQNYYKVYLTNPSLRSALFSPLEPTDEMMGYMVETAIFSQWLHRSNFVPWYSRWSGGEGEVDMVGLDAKTQKPNWAVEIKWSNRIMNSSSELKNLVLFCEKNKIKEAFVTTLDKWGTGSVNNIAITFVPSSVYAFNVGYNTLVNKYQEIVGG
jgi:predicted AAA+ superfamily ATPase